MEFNWLGMNIAAGQIGGLFHRFLGLGGTAPAPPTALPANSVTFDLETTGLEPGRHSVIEGAVYDMKSGTTWSRPITPYIGRDAVSIDTLSASASDWWKSRQKALYSWVGKDAAQVAPDEFVRQLANNLKGKVVWIQNAPFESRQMADLFKHHIGPEELASIRKMFETRPLSEASQRHLFYVTGRDIQAARQTAFQTRDWMPVFTEYLRDAARKTDAIRVRDIQDVTRAIFSESQRIGLMKATKSFVGSNINTLSLAYGFDPEVHRAPADVLRESDLLRRLWRVATGLHESRHRGLWGEAALVFSDKYREDLTAIRRVGHAQELLLQRSIARNLAEAKLALDFGEGEVKGVNDKLMSFVAPMETYEGKVVHQRIAYHLKKQPKDFDEAIRLFTSERFMSKGLTDVVEKAVLDVKTKSRAGLREMVANPLKLELDANAELIKLMDEAGKFNNWDALRFLFARHPIKMGAIAATGLYLTGATIDFATSRTSTPALEDESFVDWSGMEPYGIGSDMRHYSTDFGSGWRGLLDFTGKIAYLGKQARTTWFQQGELTALGVDIEQRVTRLAKKVSTQDFHQATSLIRRRSLAHPREMHIRDRLDNVASPRLQPGSMAEFLVGADSKQITSAKRTSFIGYRDYNIIQGLGYGRVTPGSGFGSPSIGFELLDVGILQLTGKMSGLGRKTGWVKFGEGASISIADLFKSAVGFERKVPGAGKELEYLARVHEAAGAERLGIVNFSAFMSKGYKSKVIRHETFHNLVDDEWRTQFAKINPELLKHAGLENYRWGYQPELAVEEYAAYRLGDLQTPVEILGEAAANKRLLTTLETLTEQSAISTWAKRKQLRSQLLGMQDQGIAAKLRDAFTDFGSPWKGMASPWKAIAAAARRLRGRAQTWASSSGMRYMVPGPRRVSKVATAAQEAGLSANLRGNRIEGMKKSGLSYWSRAVDHDFGRSWARLAKLMEKIGSVFSRLTKGLFKRTTTAQKALAEEAPVFTNIIKDELANQESSLIQTLIKSGYTTSEVHAQSMVQRASWFTMGGSKWARFETLGKGGFGKAWLVASPETGQVGVLKQLRPSLKPGSWGAGRQAEPWLYPARPGAAKPPTELRQRLIGNMDEVVGWMDEGNIPPEWGKGTIEEIMAAQKAYTQLYRSTTPDRELRSIEHILSYEVAMQQQARKELGDVIPEVFTGGVIEVGGERAGVGFIQEYGGRGLGSMSRRMTPEQLASVESQVREYVEGQLQRGGVFNWDLGRNNILVDPGTMKIRIIDQGGATFIKGVHDEAYKEYGKTFGNMIMERIFGPMRGEIGHVTSSNMQRAAIQGVEASGGRAVVGLEEATENSLAFAAIEADARRAAWRERKLQVTKMQHEAHKKMFGRKTGHAKGGH